MTWRLKGGVAGPQGGPALAPNEPATSAAMPQARRTSKRMCSSFAAFGEPAEQPLRCRHLASDRSWPGSRCPQTAPARPLSRYDVRRIFRHVEALRHREVAQLVAFV